MSISLQCQPYYFRHYEVETGLSNNAVMCSVQDKLGFMWFGTRDGLNRFDGYNFKVYRFKRNNLIHALCIDHNGALLVANENEIYRYDSYHDNFTLLVSSLSFPIDEIISDQQGNIWFNAGYILYKFSELSKQLKQYPTENYFVATGLSIDKKGVIWVSTLNGFLEKYNDSDDTFQSFDLFKHSNSRSPKYINNIQCTDDQQILVGTNKGGFKIFNAINYTYREIPLCCDKVNNLFIRSFLPISRSEIWIGTETGIYIYNPQTGNSIQLRKNSSDSYAISDNVVYTLCKDSENGIWAGTYFGGISQYPKQFSPFKKNYRNAIDNPLSGNIVRPITKDKFGNFWIGTEDYGLNKFDSKNKTISYYKANNKPGDIAYNSVHTLLAVENELWVGTYEHGLDIVNIKTGRVQRHYSPSAQNGLRSNFPFCFVLTKKKDIIVGTTNGIYSYNKTKDFFEPINGLPPNDSYMYVMEARDGTIWTAVPGSGVYYLNPQNGKYGNFAPDPADSTSIGSDKVNYIYEDSKGFMWFATENGLCKWDPIKHVFKNYNAINGFPSNFMLAILEDEQTGDLWISTTKGLVCFDPMNEKIKIYTNSNGLLSDQFNFNSAFKDIDDRMYFGSVKGLISFRPDEIIRDTAIPPLYITGLKIDNQDASISSPETLLHESLIYTNKITLKYNQSTFSLNFAALGFIAPQNLEYAYQLTGLSNNWTYTKNNRQADFTKLRPGSYLFRVKSSSSSGVWNNSERHLLIEILPPWWESGIAYTLYFIGSILLIFAILYLYDKRIKEKNNRKIQFLELAREKSVLQIEIAKEKEMLESKIDFFTQVAHEIKTPITLIKIPLSNVIRRTAGMTEIEKSLNIINKNTNRLIELSNQFLDFRTTEKKAYVLSLDKVNISELLSDTYSLFVTLAEESKLQLSCESSHFTFYSYVDPEAFKKIIYNLFSNAIKYGHKMVQISLVDNSIASNSFSVIFKNDGHIIPSDLKEKIFEPFFRINETEAKTGTGIGLALARSLAQLHGGSLMLQNKEDGMNTFILTLPIHREM